MRYLLLAFCLLFTSTVKAETFYMFPEWGIPVLREDGSTLLFEDIAKYTAYTADCETGIRGEVFIPDILPYLTTTVVVATIPVICLRFTTTDTDGRVSTDSDLFYLRDYRSPMANECIIN